MKYPQRNLFKIMLATSALVLGLVGWVYRYEMLSFAFDYIFKEPWEKQTLDAGNERKLRITATGKWEIHDTFYYEIEDSGHLAEPPRAFGFGPFGEADLNFQLLFSKDKNLIGLEDAATHVIFVLHDFSDGSSWPGESRDQIRAKCLKDKLQQDHRALHLFLSTDKLPEGIPLKLDTW